MIKKSEYELISRQLFEGKVTHSDIRVVENKVHNAKLKIDGYKHSMVGIIALAVAARTQLVIENPPLVIDTYVLVGIINEMGAIAQICENKLYINTTGLQCYAIPICLSGMIHGSIYLCPGLAVSMKGFLFWGSGGCQIGDDKDNNKRPVEHIMSVIEKFGGVVEKSTHEIKGNYLAHNKIVKIDILEYSSCREIISGPLVGGATKTALIMSLSCEKTIIKNAYIKTDVLDMIHYMRLLGHNVAVENHDIIVEINKKRDDSCRKITLTQCVSEIITYSTLALATNNKIEFLDLNKETLIVSLKPEFELMKKMGIDIVWEKNNMKIWRDCTIKSVNIDVLPNTIQSDHHPFFVLLLLLADGTSELTEYVWKDRFKYIYNLMEMGSCLTLDGNKINIRPSYWKKSEKSLPALDVRSAAVTLLAMILSDSRVKLTDAEHIFRGYSRLQENLELMGVKLLIDNRSK